MSTMKPYLFNLLLIPCLLFLNSCRDVNKAKSFEQMADRISKHYVEDSRVDRLEIEHKSTFQGLLVKGYTTIPEVYDSIQAVLSEGGFVVAQNNFRLLPDAKLLEGKTAGIINVSVANLRSKPGHSQELATQALMGTPIQVLDFKDGWYLVRTPDRYLAWLEPGAFVAMRPQEAQGWFNEDLRMYTGPTSVMKSEEGDIVTDLVFGNLLRYADTDWAEDKMVLVELPDGTHGYVKGSFLVPPLLQSSILRTEALLESAFANAGRPYLWGGTSPKAMDCSGFTKTAFYENGFVIPRDASQQVLAGKVVELTPDFHNLKPGDLLFFGRFREDGSEKITHVGFYTGEGRFLHAGADNGRIVEQSLRPEDEDFAEHRLKSLLQARRLEPGTEGVVPVGTAFTDILKQ
ncbi:NlpC/P60 family protein [Neolewinella aurantiaca]|uniref:NlpC/P60 family protein n=1 Tax=Neolewinella aurantiaca TaxID=2602767 RepID=A0A5C7FKZ2_9BACT|nr:C40 family peptidase [Neolewinella aurantiaca]TXF91407.1 NlpC/P60 family protein [Neolewinella aurantiaca]